MLFMINRYSGTDICHEIWEKITIYTKKRNVDIKVFSFHSKPKTKNNVESPQKTGTFGLVRIE